MHTMSTGGLYGKLPRWRKIQQYGVSFVEKHDWIQLFAISVIVFMISIAFLAPVLAPYDPMYQNLLERNQGMSDSHVFGTDHLGRDIFSRLIYGTRVSLLAGIGGAFLALFWGGVIGLLACAKGGKTERIVYSGIDLIRCMSGELLALILVVAFGSGFLPVVLALGFVFAPIFASIARAVYGREMAAEYVQYSLINGASMFWVLQRHLVPNILGTFVTQLGIIIPRCIVTESVLSFLGVGVPPDTPTWGGMIATASRLAEDNPISVIAPIFALALTSLSFVILTTSLRKSYDVLRYKDIGF